MSDERSAGTTRRLVLAGAGVLLGAGLWWRAHPSACPYGQRFWVELPHPFITRVRLDAILAPVPGERILEVGPGTGFYSLAVAERVAPGGTLEIFDVQQEMLDHTARRAAERGVVNISPRRGDARELPYEDETFDAVFLVTVLGEIPDRQAALRELARVLRPGGRLVVGELFGDPHWVSPRSLLLGATAAGLRHERRLGGPLAYFARFDRPDA